MKKIIFILSIFSCVMLNAQIKMPATSSTQTIIQDFGLGKIELTYSRPNIKGRTLFKEGSELAPLGKVWRTGANSATKLKITTPISINGNALDTGVYAIFTIPSKSDFIIILNKDSKNWGTDYVEADDIFRITVPSYKMKESMETFTMQFAKITMEACELHLMWGNTAVTIPITTNVKEVVRTQIEKALGADKIAGNIYSAAATFYYEMDKDYNKALTNIVKATEANSKAFWLFLLKAKIERELGDKVASKISAEKVIELATAAKNDDYIRSATELINKL